MTPSPESRCRVGNSWNASLPKARDAAATERSGKQEVVEPTWPNQQTEFERTERPHAAELAAENERLRAKLEATEIALGLRCANWLTRPTLPTKEVLTSSRNGILQVAE